MFIYNIVIYICALLGRISGLYSRKARLFWRGRKGLLKIIEQRVTHDRPIAWVHVASLGEFEQGRPLIEKIRSEHPDYQILVTFFSPSGYEIRKNYEGADYIFYLPIDTPRNAKKFLNAIKPQMAIFVKYEYWLNYLSELRRRRIKTYIVSTIFRRDSIFFKTWGSPFRAALRGFETIFVQDKESQTILSEIDVTNVIVAGDTRFDRVWDIAQKSRELPEIERFKANNDLFIAGSTWPADEEILMELVDKYPSIKFIIAPHEIDSERIDAIMSRLGDKGVRYSEYNGQEVQALVLDTMGMLSGVYKYAKWGYIGGGFGRGIHNTLEAATFGLPIAFGPNYQRFKEAQDLIKLGVAHSVNSDVELEMWFRKLYNNDERRAKLSQKTLDFMAQSRGAVAIIMGRVFQER